MLSSNNLQLRKNQIDEIFDDLIQTILDIEEINILLEQNPKDTDSKKLKNETYENYHNLRDQLKQISANLIDYLNQKNQPKSMIHISLKKKK